VAVERVVTSGVFALDGQEWDVENNVWLVGDDAEVVVVDAAHDFQKIAEAVGSRRVTGILLTHGHNDHINAAVPLAAEVGDAPVYLHPDDLMLWRDVYATADPDLLLTDGLTVVAGGVELTTIHTPGHSPGGCCFYDGGATLLSGDTLFKGGPGNTSRSFSDFPTILESISRRLLTLPAGVTVHPGHGDTTTIGDEAPHFDEWVARGH